ncbi:hypothetical protein [Pseudomonas graminis]|uniref:hypothetical protein n=1 Tax=Pseudomonas graminis TaxID=158627 RepID=UPI003C2454BB
MKKYSILCYQSQFAEFKNYACEYISEMPADEQDQFATVMALSAGGAIGFDKTCEGRDTISSLVSKCYRVDLRNMSIQPPQENYSGRMPRLLFRSKNGGFEKLLEEHLTYEKNLKKFLVLSRHRHADKPKISRLAGILQDSNLPITDKELFKILQETCHYLLVPIISREHGQDAFFVFSRNLDYFFKEFNSIVDGRGELNFVDSALKLPFN